MKSASVDGVDIGLPAFSRNFVRRAQEKMTKFIIASLFGVAACAVAFALLLPQARLAGAILAAQDDPVQLSDVRLDATLRERPAVRDPRQRADRRG